MEFEIAAGALGVLGCIAGVVVIVHASKLRPRDATPQEALQLAEGTEVWLRGTRDRDRPLRSSSGSLVYPATEDSQLVVDCGPGECAGPLIGRVESLVLEDRRPVRVLLVGSFGDEKRQQQMVGAGIAICSALLAFVGWLAHKRRSLQAAHAGAF